MKEEKVQAKTEAKTINEKELEVLNFWNENKIFEKSLAENKGGDYYTFYDGPPFATGLPHPGHLLQSYIKDSIPRFQTMKGKYVRRVWGWDTHGLPIENLIEKNLELKNKKDIENLGISNFTKACSDIVLQYDQDWKSAVPRWGRWVDMENRYATFSNTYTESCWWAFSELYKKGLAYEGYKVMHICPRCETPLAASEVVLNYQDIKDISAFVKFELLDEPNTYLLAWTTTPWTLPGNTAIAINKNIVYSKVSFNGENFIVAKDLLGKVFENKEEKTCEILEEFSGEKLIGKKYKPVFDYYNNSEFINNLKNVHGEKNGENIFKVWHADFVTADTGTGIAHEAPAFGEDDYNLAIENNIPTILHVKMDGRFTDEVVDFKGERVKWKGETQATDKKICEFLQNKNLIFKTEIYTHSYPLCWRCDTPLLNYATNSWFVAVSKMREKLISENKKVYWVPDNVRDGRMGQWLEGARDWALSRNRYWGAPIPVWKSEKEIFIPGSLKDLQNRTKAKNNYILLRHGETDANVLKGENDNLYIKGISGIIDVALGKDKPLNENGKKQAAEVFEKLKGKNLENIDLIICSPYLRTKETAEIVAKDLQIDISKIVFSDLLKEWQVGESNNGKSWEQLYVENKDLNYLYYKLEGADETKVEVQNRMSKLISNLEAEFEGKNILLVTHKSPISAIISRNNGELFEMGTGNLPKVIDTKNCEVVELNYKPLPVDEKGEVNFHLPHIDNLKVFDESGNLMKREGGVFDCWYESGSMPFAQFHYPFENEELFKKNFPAEFIAEAQDQTRGWFYTMLILGVGLFDKSPFKSVITSGMINAADGKKISKKLKNYTDPLELLEKFGSDSLRYYLLSTPVVKGENIKFSDEGVKQVYSKNISRLLNVVSFYKMYAGSEPQSILGESQSKNVMDKFILARFRQVKIEVTKGFEELFVDAAFRPIEKFIDDLSVWYLRRSRDRFKSEDENVKKEALETTKYILENFAKVLAPIFPFTSEMIWQEIKNETQPLSVHLAAWGNVEELDVSDAETIEKMELTREAVSAILDERVKAGIKVRQPLESVIFFSEKFQELKVETKYLVEIMDETNIREIKFENKVNDKVCELDLNITEELKIEGVYREIVRMLQDKRKENNLKVSDVVNLQFDEKISDFEKQVIESKKVELQKECGIKNISFGAEFKIIN